LSGSYIEKEGEAKPAWKPSDHLHMIREEPPKPQPGYRICKAFCVGCQKPVWIVHVELPRENTP
jgi:hypothetical protein